MCEFLFLVPFGEAAAVNTYLVETSRPHGDRTDLRRSSSLFCHRVKNDFYFCSILATFDYYTPEQHLLETSWTCPLMEHDL